MRGRGERLSLLTRLLILLVGLATLGLLSAGVVTYTALRSFLFDRVDEQLTVTSRAVLQEFRHGGTTLSGPGRAAGDRSAFPHGTVAELRPEGGEAQRFRFLEAADTDPEELIDLAADLRPAADGTDRRYTVQAAGAHPSYRVAVSAPTPTEVLVVGVPLSDAADTLDRFVVVGLGVVLGVVVLLTIVGRGLVMVGLRPLRRIEATAGAIAAGDLSQRVPPGPPETEVGRLSAALNVMLAQIEEAFTARAAAEDRLRSFVADAGHELRTPLTSIRGYAELFHRVGSERPDELAKVLRRVEEEANRMGVLVDDLLLLAQLDEDRPLHRLPVDLAHLASDAVNDAHAIAPDRDVELSVEGPVFVLGDQDQLLQVLANLLANARVHTPPDTWVGVSVRVDGTTAVTEVSDRGPGLEAESARRVFERFYRPDASRSRGGSGLGLAIVEAIVRGHEGRVQVMTAPGAGATFRVELPRLPGS